MLHELQLMLQINFNPTSEQANDLINSPKLNLQQNQKPNPHYDFWLFMLGVH